MKTQKIITIGRQFGSGGHEIGNRLATRLEIPLYDNNLVRMVAEKLDIRKETAQAVDETTLNGFLSGYVISSMEKSSQIDAEEYIQPLSEQVFDMQSEIIRKLAQTGPCVIIGRCADFILKDDPRLLNVFICAEDKERINRIAERYDMSKKKAADKMKRIDRERKYYYESHTGLEWGSIHAHEILLNATLLGMDGTVEVLEKLVRDK